MAAPLPAVPAAPSGEHPENARFVEEVVEQALLPYAKLFPPSIVQAMRETLAEVMVTHPVLVPLTRPLRNDKSGVQKKEGGEGE
ncbi:MAG: hypothetical protein ABI193_08345 [Minicystis sp.]